MIDYQDNDTNLEGYFAYDSIQEPMPAVLICHAWAGRDEFVCEKARRLAGMGYVAFALDMYGKGILGSGIDENSALMQPFMEDRELLQGRISCALDRLRQFTEVDSTKVAAMGFCFGGLCVLDLARSGAELSGVISFHGLFSAPANTEGNRILAKVLLLHGQDDPMVSEEEVKAIKNELTHAHCDWQLHVYGNTMHAFTNPSANDPEFGTVYNSTVDARSWVSMVNFLEEIF